MANKVTARELFDAAFSGPRDPRSKEYKAGVLAALEYRVERLKIRVPYPLGTPQADAFFSGLDEGHAIWRRLKYSESEGAEC